MARAEEYRIDPTASELHILVRRAGPLRRAGHNHVIAVQDLTGHVERNAMLDGSTVELYLPVDRLAVDVASVRARYGAEFASTPTEREIEGTTANMLGEDVLDAAAYPRIGVAGVLRTVPDGYVVDAEISVARGVWHGSIPVELELGSNVLVARGRMEIAHAALGLKPFSIMLGALRVAEMIEIRFSLTARRAISN